MEEDPKVAADETVSTDDEPGGERPTERADEDGSASVQRSVATPSSPAPTIQATTIIADGPVTAPESPAESAHSPAQLASTPSVTPHPATSRQATTTITPAPSVPSTPLEVIATVMTGAIRTILAPFIAALPTDPPAQLPFAWAVLAFVRRNFFNEAPVVTNVAVAQQTSTGVITGDIDAADPDELGKTVDVRASVFAGAAVPSDCECEQLAGYIGLPFTNPAVLGEKPGDNWHAPAAVDNTCVYLNPADFSLAFYRGTETGEVTIDGLGTGDVVLEFEGTLIDGGVREQSFATLVPELGTGDLKGVSGNVMSISAFNADGSLNGVLTGRVVRPELRYVVVSQATHGTVSVDEVTGAFTYTPDPDFAETGGTDSFQVVVTDGRFNVLNAFLPYNGDPVHTVALTVESTSA